MNFKVSSSHQHRLSTGLEHADTAPAAGTDGFEIVCPRSGKLRTFPQAAKRNLDRAAFVTFPTPYHWSKSPTDVPNCYRRLGH